MGLGLRVYDLGFSVLGLGWFGFWSGKENGKEHGNEMKRRLHKCLWGFGFPSRRGPFLGAHVIWGLLFWKPPN